MRLWHKDLIPILPDKQLLGQWRECCLIAKNIKEKGMFENTVCSSECGRRCIHYKRVNELYEKGLR
jgi:uncharacterized protein (TIGR02328 family)